MSEVPRRSVSVLVREIFVEAVNRQDLNERTRYPDDACGGVLTPESLEL
jgi:hypothetical protein